MKRLDLSLPEFAFVVATRAALGVGIGMLASERLRRKQRRATGLTLVLLGALTTIPAAIAVVRAGRKSRSVTSEAT